MTNRKISYILSILAATLLMASCAPVNFMTKTKKVPRQYSVNYNYDNVKSERSDLNKKVWVVYSDREGNVTTMRPGGTLAHKELGYMEPLYVIGRKGDYYKLIKYDPSVLKNERLSKRKEAEFYGWIHKDLLLLFNNSETEVRNGIKLKSLTAITDCSVILEAEKYFSNDSLLLYSGPKLADVCGSVGLNSMVYVLKSADNGSRLLIAQKTAISPDEVGGMAIGWVDASLVTPFGQRLALSSPPDITVNPFAPDTLPAIRTAVSPVSLSPAIYAHRVDSMLVFRTLDASDIIDHSGNRIYNVNGAPITYEQGKQIAARLKNINVIFAFIPTKNVLQQTPMISNAIQNLKPVFDSSLGYFSYSYGAVMGNTITDFESDYLSFSDRLIETGKNMKETASSGFTTVMRDALKLASLNPDETNVIVLIGERASGWGAIPQDVQDGLVKSSCRLLSYQVYADNEDAYNNFVLQSLDMIEHYAEQCRTLKRKITVYSDQLRSQNLFLEGVKNAYSLDFPNRSMTQGMVIFPEKGRFTEPELLIMGVDSLMKQVTADNRNLIQSIDKAFMQVGRHRSRFYSAVTGHLAIDPQTKIAPYIGKAFNETSPQWVGVTDRIDIQVDSLNMAVVGLLLTETELEKVKAWVESLASMKPDIKGEVAKDKNKVRHVKRVRRDLRGVPADELDVQTDQGQGQQTDSLADRKYASTRAIRKQLKRNYRSALRGCVFEGSAGRLTLAQAQEYITTMPTISPELNAIRIKDLKRKKRFTDEELDLLIQYFEEHVKLIEEQAIPVDDLTVPDGEKFFFLPSGAMP